MKKQSLFISCIIMSCILVLLQSCLKDTYTRSYTYTYYAPVYKKTQQVRDNIKSNAPQPIERPGKIYIKGQYIFLNEIDKGIHIIDNSNPDQPQNFAFIDIPGNMDLAVKGNTLYADLYTDLVAIDISDPPHAVLKKIVENIFPRRYYDYLRPDSTKVIASWQKRDTTVTERFDINEWQRRGQVFFAVDMIASNNGGNKSGPSVSASPYGVGGSMARFAITNERLYTAGNENLDVFNITNAENPLNVSRKNMGWNIETIYPFMNKLFIGTQTGMLIYDISSPDNPKAEGQFSHVRSCDPVIADNQYAYVTLRSGSTCQGFSNQLDILDLSNLSNPSLLKTYLMTNPHGLSKDGNTLFICDGTAGLKIYNASSPTNLQLVQQISGIETYDVIAWNNNALVVTKDGLYQYDYSNINSIRLRSKITITK
jgi:hypothetical protein